MAEKLRKVIEIVVSYEEEVNSGIYPRNEVINRLYDKVYSEIEDEVITRYTGAVKARVVKDLSNNRIKDYKELAFSGLFLALAVGLLVNQLTELIGIIKGTVSVQYLCITVGISIIFAFISGMIFANGFSLKLKELIKRKTLK